MLKKYLIIAILLLSNPYDLHASTVHETVKLEGNEERIAKGIFSHVLKEMPDDQFIKERQALISFKSYIQNILNLKKLDTKEASEKLSKAKEILDNLQKQNEELYHIIHAFYEDLNYLTDNNDVCMEQQFKKFVEFIAKIKVEEITAFYEVEKFPKGKVCRFCNFSYSDRKKINSTVKYSCSLCGLGK